MKPVGDCPSETENARDAESELTNLKVWLVSAFGRHTSECKTQLVALESALVEHIMQLKHELITNETKMGRDLSNAISCISHDLQTMPPEDEADHDSEKHMDSNNLSQTSTEKFDKISEKVGIATAELSQSYTREMSTEYSLHDTSAEWEAHHEKKSPSIVGKIVSSTYFDILVAFAIVASAVVMFVELQWCGDKARVSLGLQDEPSWGHQAKDYFSVLEHSFNVIFVIELIARLAHQRCGIFKDGFAILDMILIVSTSIHLYILSPLDIRTGARSSMFRIVRLTRLVRVLRFVRVMKLCGELRVLVNTCVACIQALVWSMIFLGVIMLSSGLFLTQLVHEAITDTALEMETRMWAYRYYGSAVRSMYSLFEITLAGCWPTYFRPLVEKVSWGYSLVAFFYIFLVVFALIRIITALFLKETLRVASADSQALMNEHARNKKDNPRKLEKVFKAMDVEDKGKLTIHDFHNVISHPTVQVLLQNMGMELHDTQMLFRLLDDGDGYVTYEEFVQGVIRLRGQAREIDVIAILHSEDKVQKMLGTLCSQMNELVASLPSRTRFVQSRGAHARSPPICQTTI